MNTLSFKSLYQAITLTSGSGETKFYRPMSCLTLAFNWYFGKSNVWGYHLVNTVIHCLSAVFLFLFVKLSLSLPKIYIKDKKNILFISLLSAVLWAINPIQTQAVTYIIQRMASLAGMFYILSMLLYLKARCFTPSAVKLIPWYIGCILAFLMALLSKQNAFLLPFSILLMEAVLILDLKDPRIRNRFIVFFISSVIIGVISGILIFYNGDPLSFLKGYEERGYTPFQRVLTQPRVLVFHLSQIFYPIPTRLSLEHYVMISTSLVSPWQTLPSILMVMILIGVAIYKSQTWPLLSFATLFFFLNHSIESSVLNLELIFEHRNYIPSMFLFVPVAAGLKCLLDHYRTRRPMYFILVMFSIFLVVDIGMATYIRNQIWQSEKTLWEDVVKKYPNSARAYHNLAWGHYEGIGDYDKAIELYNHALTKENNTSNKWWQITVHSNLTHIYYNKNAYDLAEEHSRKAIAIAPFNASYHWLALIYLNQNKLKKSLTHIQEAIRLAKTNDGYLYTAPLATYYSQEGLTYLRLSKPLDAVASYQKSLEIKKSMPAYIGIAAACSRTKYASRAKWYLNQAMKLSRSSLIHLYFADHYYLTGKKELAIKEVRQFISKTSFNDIKKGIEKLTSQMDYAPVHEDIIPMIRTELAQLHQSLSSYNER